MPPLLEASILIQIHRILDLAYVCEVEAGQSTSATLHRFITERGQPSAQYGAYPRTDKVPIDKSRIYSYTKGMETKDILNCKLTILMNDKDRKRFDIACTENNTTMAEEVRAFIKGRIAELNKAAGKK